MEQNQEKPSAQTTGPLIEFTLPDLNLFYIVYTRQELSVLIMSSDTHALSHSSTHPFSYVDAHATINFHSGR